MITHHGAALILTHVHIDSEAVPGCSVVVPKGGWAWKTVLVAAALG